MDTSVIPESSAILEASADNGTKVLQPEIVGSPLPLALFEPTFSLPTLSLDVYWSAAKYVSE